MFRPKNHKEKVLHRLKITRGHLEKIIQMVGSDEYCIETLHQSLAVQKALREVDQLILENHLKTCASNAIKQGKQSEAIKEVMQVFRRINP